ncbi:helix-turn-helix transcriptional regulator [Pedobacter sp. KR3-3]|uniref:Helix-turn-helix transcriptional regulator n=1 Tax=Pedobacter albus TaxID=3113905 RepID=A0ABU7ICM8_9SPHI|nr:helix-turn-helix transcriptional regulator [Pedobacter sp. KR3-3]MEE1947136.1 helix-turn-helix transcriptional regulator [Pedobacter sp. KR3-3]
MNTHIIAPKHPLLKKHIQYFLFFKQDAKVASSYVTFPNNNLCLAIYKNNHVEYQSTAGVNNCKVSNGQNSFTSRLYGFHNLPFKVQVQSDLDQVCILFSPAALRLFTKEAYKDLLSTDDVFNAIFQKSPNFLEALFGTADFFERAALLETLLLKNLNLENLPSKMNEALQLISAVGQNKALPVEELAKTLQLNESTLYRLFSTHLGQNPKGYLKTLRFRHTLNELMAKPKQLTQVAYSNHYFDQAHLIKDFKTFTGCTPKELTEHVSVKERNLVWLYNEV